MAAPPFHTLRVADVERLCDDAAAVTFEVPAGLEETYAFDAGQSLTLRRWVGGREERRSYSICAPAGSRPRIGVREIPDGLFSSWLVRQVQVGDDVEVQAPSGGFRVDPGAGGRHLCIAAGSGITPVLSIAGTVLAGSPDAEVTLLYGNRTTGSVMFAEELGDLKNSYGPRLQVVHVLSREPREVELLSGRLDGDRVRRLLDALVAVEGLDHVWLCGPWAMVTQVRAVLAEAGVPADRVHAELFHVDEPPPELTRAAAVPTGATSEVTVVLDGTASTATVGRERSLLDGAQETRSDLPFACKGGVCGTCRALVREGEVDMRRNYALEPEEVVAGFVLTCQTYPVGERVTVDFDAWPARQEGESVDEQQTAETAVARMWAGDAASRALGMRLDGVGPGRATVSMTVRDDMVNGWGLAHGGLVASLADSAFAAACNSRGTVTVAAGFDVTFLDAAHAGDELVATAEERALRGRSGLYDVTVRRTDGTVVAEFRGRSRTAPDRSGESR